MDVNECLMDVTIKEEACEILDSTTAHGKDKNSLSSILDVRFPDAPIGYPSLHMQYKAERRRRERSESGKRWNPDTLTKLIQVLRQIGKDRIEKPTAQIFYKKVIEEHEELRDYSWTNMRDKVRNLKAKLKLAIDWRNSTGAALQESEETIHEHLLKICPRFDELQQLFGSRTKNAPFAYDSELSNSVVIDMTGDDADVAMPESDLSEVQAEDSPPEPTVRIVAMQDVTPSSTTPPCKQPIEIEPPINKKFKKKSLNNSSVQYLAQIQQERQKYLQRKLDFEMECEAHRRAFEREKFKVEAALKEKELKIKEKEIELRLQIDKERLAQELKLKQMELQMKYNNAS